jgi:aspartate/methionine/tyrosine aminotransferase
MKLICDPGDTVLVPAPSYPLVPHLAQLEGVAIDTYPLTEAPDFAIDLEAVDRGLAAGARAVVVVAPNNPTGTAPNPSQWRSLAQLCARHGSALVVDRVFAPYGPGGASLELPLDDDGPLVFVLDGLSKAVGLPQFKLGWIVLRGRDSLTSRARQGLEWAADAYLSVAAPVQHAAAELLALAPRVQSAINRRLVDNRATLRRELAALPQLTLHADAGWYACVRLPSHLDEEAVVGRLVELHGVLVHPGFFYDFVDGAWLVVSLLPAPSELARGAAALVVGLDDM